MFDHESDAGSFVVGHHPPTPSDGDSRASVREGSGDRPDEIALEGQGHGGGLSVDRGGGGRVQESSPCSWEERQAGRSSPVYAIDRSAHTRISCAAQKKALFIGLLTAPAPRLCDGTSGPFRPAERPTSRLNPAALKPVPKEGARLFQVLQLLSSDIPAPPEVHLPTDQENQRHREHTPL